jgi:DegV family protein with EDD domain
MTIKIVTDSTCDLPPALIAQYNIAVIPLYINIGEQSFLDDGCLPRDAFYQRLAQYDPPMTTAAPGPNVFFQAYQQLITEGATGIISIHVAGNLSATFANACAAAKDITAAPVKVIDSQQLSLGTGFLAVTAAKAATAGYSPAQIVPQLISQIPRTYLFAILDDLDFLARSGRANHLLARLGSLLQIKPVFKLHRGVPATERVRTHKQALKRVASLATERTPLEYLGVIHSNALQQAQTLRQQIQSLLPQPDILVADLSPIIAAHVGPGAVGLVCVHQ